MSPQAQLYAYMDGWRDGAGGKPMNLNQTCCHPKQMEVYEKGYTEGRLARGSEMRRYAEEIGASVNVIRAL